MNRVCWKLPIGVILALLVFASESSVVALSEFASGVRAAYNTDLIQPYLLMHAPLEIPRWYLSPANYAVPDCLVAGILNLLRVPMTLMPVVYGGILLSGYALAISALLACATDMNGTVGLLVGAITVGLLQLLAGLHPEGLGTNMTLSLAAAFIHTGAVLMGLFSLAAITQLAFASQPSDRFGTLGLSLVALFASFSDLLYIVWFLLPGLVVWGAARWLENRRFVNRQLVVALSAAVAGALLGHVYTTSTGTSNPDYGRTLQSMEIIWSNISSGRDIVFAADLAVTLVMGLYLVVAVWRASEERSISKFDFVACLIATAQIASLALPIVSGQLFDPAHVRYCLPVFLLPAIWGVLWASRRAPRLLPKWATGGALASLTVLFLLALGPQSASAARALGGQSELTNCLIAAGLRDGVTDYWNAKSLIFGSNYLLSVVQVADKGELYRWNYNSLWFSRSSDGSRSVAPTFVVLDRLDPVALAKRFGEPTSISHCGASVIWTYDHALSW